MDRHRGRLRERENHPLTAVGITYLGLFFLSSSGQSFWFAWFRVHIWYITGFSPVCARVSQPRWILPKRHMGRVSVSTTLLLTSREPFCTYVVREISWLREWEICGLGRVQSPLLIVLLFLSWSFCPQGMNLLSLYPGWEPDLPPASTGLPEKSLVLTLEG